MSPAAGRRARPRRRRRGEESDAAPSGMVAVVGRPNVGKSTLFNRLIGERRAIVDPTAGLTRDRLYGVADWRGRRFTVVDTAGLDPRLDAPDADHAELARGIQQQARVAIAEADLCCLVVDVRAGVTALDQEVAGILRAGGRPVVLCGNKVDGGAQAHYAHELYALGLGEPTLISALQGTDTGDLLDRLVDALPAPREEPPGPPAGLRLAIVGRPNVGKSSLLNAIAGEERALVSPVAGTTRDAVDTRIERGGDAILLVDTAGIRRRGVVGTDVEHYSLLRSLRAMERADVALLVVDASGGTVAQDRHIAGYAADAGRGLVVALNKWDLLDEATRANPATLRAARAAFGFVPGTPVVTSNALAARNLDRILDACRQVAAARATRVPTPALNQLLRLAFDEHPPRFHRGRRLRLLYATQAAAASPTFVLFVNDPELMHFSYRRYLENRLRAVFGFQGVPLRVVARARAESRAS